MQTTRFLVHDLVQVEVDEETLAAVVIDGRTGVICSANETAAVLIESLQNGATQDELAAVLEKQFRVRRTRARSDVVSFLEMLGAMGYLASQQTARGGPLIAAGQQ